MQRVADDEGAQALTFRASFVLELGLLAAVEAAHVAYVGGAADALLSPKALRYSALTLLTAALQACWVRHTVVCTCHGKKDCQRLAGFPACDLCHLQPVLGCLQLPEAGNGHHASAEAVTRSVLFANKHGSAKLVLPFASTTHSQSLVNTRNPAEHMVVSCAAVPSGAPGAATTEASSVLSWERPRPPAQTAETTLHSTGASCLCASMHAAGVAALQLRADSFALRSILAKRCGTTGAVLQSSRNKTHCSVVTTLIVPCVHAAITPR